MASSCSASDGYKLSDEIEGQIEDLLDKDMTAQLAKSQEIGRAKRVEGDIYRYIEHAKRTLPRDVTLQGLRVCHRLRQRCRLQGRPSRPLGTRRRCRDHRQ